MSESITVEASSTEVKIKAMASSPNPALEVSVSFGRFENDSSLSWEKWSTFSPNKYLEEVEKCATPGSVARKNAYFEEHYKKIAARKAELLAQHNPLESPSLNSDCGDLVHESNPQCSNEGDKQESNLVSEEPEIASPCQIPWVEELKEKIDSIVESEEKHEIMSSIVESEEKQEIKSSIVESEEKQEIMSSIVERPELNKPEETAPEEAFLVPEETAPEEAFSVPKEVETFSKGSQHVKELSHRSERVIKNTPKIKDKNLKLGESTKSHKVKAVNKERNDSRIKKKPTSPVTKKPQVSASRASKPTLTPTALSAPRTRSKTGSALSYSSPKTKTPYVEQSKKVAPRSLHMSMSLSLDPSNSIPASFMEKMGDKDIVKRAFKTFQSNNQLKPSIQEQSLAAKPAPAKGRESRVSTLTTPQKENGGCSRVSRMEKTNAKASPSYSGLKSDERVERRKEPCKKLEGKYNDREAERKNLQTKSKDNRDAEMKKLRQSFNFKASPLPSVCHGQRTSKSPQNKIGSKSDIHR